MRSCFPLLLAAGLLLPVLPLHAEKPQADQERAAIAALIARLASDDFQARQDAAAALDRLGTAALPALRAARKHPDPEVRRQVAELLSVLERRTETARQLETPRLRLQYRNTPLAEVLADLSSRSGNPLKLGAVSDEVSKRLVTLDGEWTFWEALERVCAAANISEPESEAVPSPSVLPIDDNFRGRAGRRFLYLESLRSGKSAKEIEPLKLTDGRPTSRSTFQAGALRIRMLGPRASCPIDDGGNNKHAPLTLEIKPEPRIGWERLAALRIDRVLDARGQEMTPPPFVLGDTKLEDLDPSVIIIWDGQGEWPLAAAPQLFALSFPVHDRTGSTLREVHGTVAGWVRTAPETLISIDNLAKSLNVPQTGPESCRLKVLECGRDEDGLYKLRIELTPPENPQWTELLNRHIVRRNRRIVEKDTTVLESEDMSPFTLAGEQGNKLAFVNGFCEHDSNGSSRVYTLCYKPDKNDKGPAKLAYRDRRSVFVEVPFTLKDVPLYQSDLKR
jgi:hypothetical protein